MRRELPEHRSERHQSEWITGAAKKPFWMGSAKVTAPYAECGGPNCLL
jgi:hypothetical protein